MRAKYPNLELIEYIAWQILEKKYGVSAKTAVALSCSADVFLQTWPDTAIGLRTDPSQIAGQALTDAYTTVLHLSWHDKKEGKTYAEIFGGKHECWQVFFDGKPAYIVDEPKDAFFEDLKDRNMSSLLDAEGRY